MRAIVSATTKMPALKRLGLERFAEAVQFTRIKYCGTAACSRHAGSKSLMLLRKCRHFSANPGIDSLSTTPRMMNEKDFQSEMLEKMFMKKIIRRRPCAWGRTFSWAYSDRFRKRTPRRGGGARMSRGHVGIHRNVGRIGPAHINRNVGRRVARRLLSAEPLLEARSLAAATMAASITVTDVATGMVVGGPMVSVRAGE